MSLDTHAYARNLPAAVLVVTSLLAAGAQAQPGEKYVKTRAGDRPKPIVAVDNVCAWPNLTVLADGSVVATIFNQPSHGSVAGDVECWATGDGGRTWQKRGTPAPHEPDTNRMNVAAGRAADGDLIVIASGWSNRYPADRRGSPFRAGILEPWVCRSSDGGRTWAVDKEAFPAQGPAGGAVIPFGDVCRAADATLRTAVYTCGTPRNDRVYVYRSPDDGKTWGRPVPLDDDHARNETALVHLGGGNWLAAARTFGRDETGMSGYLDLYASADDAASWQHRSPVTASMQHPAHLLRLEDGRVLLSYGNRTSDRGVDVRLSNDHGKTFGPPLRVVDFQGDGGYPSSVELPGGQILTAYYASAIEGHHRYHMGAVVWPPPPAAR